MAAALSGPASEAPGAGESSAAADGVVSRERGLRDRERAVVEDGAALSRPAIAAGAAVGALGQAILQGHILQRQRAAGGNGEQPLAVVAAERRSPSEASPWIVKSSLAAMTKAVGPKVVGGVLVSWLVSVMVCPAMAESNTMVLLPPAVLA